jgi:competence protein ComEA
MFQPNERELRLLAVLALILALGGVVRLISAVRPRWTPGLAGGADAADTSAPAATPESFGDARDLDSLFVDGRLDINAAGTDHLQLLPRIGPALAARMVDTRRRRGRFDSVDDLLEVQGIGPKTLERLRPLITVR